MNTYLIGLVVISLMAYQLHMGYSKSKFDSLENIWLYFWLYFQYSILFLKIKFHLLVFVHSYKVFLFNTNNL